MRKYLDDINCFEDARPDLWCLESDRIPQWEESRNIYGFDERETWRMATTFYCWLYERVKMYLEIAPVDLEDCAIDFKGKEYTQLEMINKILEECEIALTKQDYMWSEEEETKVHEITEIWDKLMYYMWW